ncbi:MAG: UDP-N-acetylmuramoyl-tripeptide--D-alanyl-D-alanine ligase [Chloroflexi bacterium]|nr:UDP-N-acetylmuramoyl-tripeptide--D-alanyl-D-alanine ligase [Chloroflexota bacterium]
MQDARDGHDFVADAFARGARAAVVERAPEDIPGLTGGEVLVRVADARAALRALAESLRSEHAVPAVGITGSVGKTTAKEATAAALGARHRVLRTEASFNNELGVPLTLLRLEPSHDVAVIEMGFYVPGEIADLCTLVRPQVGLVTTIPDAPPHFARTPSLDAIVAGKRELIESLPPDGVAVLNADDARVRGMAARTRARVVLYGESADAELRATRVEAKGRAGLRMTVIAPEGEVEVHAPVPGRHLVAPLLGAIGAARALGVPLDEAATCVGAFTPPPHRMSVRTGARAGLTVLDDSYNASPAAVRGALDVLAGESGARIAVLGDMLELGSLAIVEHERIGALAAGAADVLVGVGDLGAVIVNAARRAGMREAHRAADAAEALVLLRRVLPEGTATVLVKGSRALRLDELADALAGTGA